MFKHQFQESEPSERPEIDLSPEDVVPWWISSDKTCGDPGEILGRSMGIWRFEMIIVIILDYTSQYVGDDNDPIEGSLETNQNVGKAMPYTTHFPGNGLYYSNL